MCKSRDCEHFNYLILMDLIVDLPVTINAEQLKLPNHELYYRLSNSLADVYLVVFSCLIEIRKKYLLKSLIKVIFCVLN